MSKIIKNEENETSYIRMIRDKKKFKYINLYDKNNNNYTKFIITFKKKNLGIELEESFSQKIADSFFKYSIKFNKINKLIQSFEQIIITEKNYFNIYIDLEDNVLSELEIQKIVIKIDDISYEVDEVFDYKNFAKIHYFKSIGYPYLSKVLLIILEIIHVTNYIEPIILRSEIVKRAPELCNTVLLVELSEIISYFNKKKNE